MNVVHTEEYKGYSIEIHTDEDGESPREWDNLGTMYCEHRNYTLGDEHAESPFIEDEETGAKKPKENILMMLPLYLYDHSGLTMNTTGFSCNWDSGMVGVIYITKEKAQQEYGKRLTKKTLETIKRVLVGEVKTYDDYLQGNVYGWIVKDSEENEIDSVCGYFPDHEAGKELDYIISEAKSAVDGDIEEARKTVEACAL